MTAPTRHDIQYVKDAATAARRSLERAAVAFANCPPEEAQPAGDALCFAASIYSRRQGDYLKALRRAKQASDAGIERRLEEGR